MFKKSKLLRTGQQKGTNKFRIQETINLLKCADNSTNIKKENIGLGCGCTVVFIMRIFVVVVSVVVVFLWQSLLWLSLSWSSLSWLSLSWMLAPIKTFRNTVFNQKFSFHKRDKLTLR